MSTNDDMKITKDNTMFELILTDEEKSSWLDGSALYWGTSKDSRPEFNYYEYFDNFHQNYYKLRDMAHDLPLNKVPQDIVDGLDNLKVLQDLCEEYANHLLGRLIKESLEK